MNNPLMYFWRHPRRTGFIAFNVVVIAAFVAWGTYTAGMADDGLAGVPNVLLGYAGMTFLVMAWAIGWGAWAYLVTRRQLRRRHQ